MSYDGVYLMTGVSVRTLKRYVAQNAIPHIRYSARVVRFSREAIKRWISERTRGVETKEQAQ